MGNSAAAVKLALLRLIRERELVSPARGFYVILSRSLAFRGGAALYKLHIRPPARYSEDIDFVQVNTEPAGPLMGALRDALDPWLGKPQWKQTEGRVTFVYRFESEDAPPLRLRLKVEINSREHFSVYGLTVPPFAVASRQLKHAIDEYLTAWNEDPKPFIWTATVEEIMDKRTRAQARWKTSSPDRSQREKTFCVNLFLRHYTKDIECGLSTSAAV